MEDAAFARTEGDGAAFFYEFVNTSDTAEQENAPVQNSTQIVNHYIIENSPAMSTQLMVEYVVRAYNLRNIMYGERSS